MALKVAMHNWMRPEPIEAAKRRSGMGQMCTGFDTVVRMAAAT